jgi:hypothetical protein
MRHTGRTASDKAGRKEVETMKRKPVHSVMPQATPAVRAQAFAFGLYIVFLMPNALDGQVLSDEPSLYGIAARTFRALLLVEHTSHGPLLTNDIDTFLAAYIPTFVQGYHFGLTATTYGLHRLLSPVPSSERFGALFRLAQELFLEEPLPADTQQIPAVRQVNTGLQRLYQLYTRQQGRAVSVH